jgi:hypothetical protein
MKRYNDAKKILFADYKNIMSAYSLICTQIEFQENDLSPDQISAKAAYYTVVWRYLEGVSPMVSSIEKFIKQNLDIVLTEIDNELAIAILIESKIHDLEINGLASVVRNQDGTTVINLTDKGKEVSKRLKKDVRD